MPRRLALHALLVAAAYYVGARVGIAFTLQPAPVSTLWPPNAILLASLILFPKRYWWVPLAAAFPAHIAAEAGAGIPIPMVLCWFVSNCAEAVIGAVLLRRLGAVPLRLDTLPQVAAFVISCVIAAPILSSFLDAAFVSLNRWGSQGYWDVWRMRTFSNVLANLMLVPPIVTVASFGADSWQRTSPRRRVEGWALALALLVICGAVFLGQHPARGASPALLYAPFPLLLWAAVRFGPRGIAGAVLIFGIIASWGGAHGLGPFVEVSPFDNALAIQAFLIVTSVPLMALAAMIEERRAATIAAQTSEERLHIALSAGQLCTWEWDVARDRIVWSDQAGKVLGSEPATAGDLSGLVGAVHPDDQTTFTRVIGHVLERPAAFGVEFRVMRPDGAVGWVFCKGKPASDEPKGPGRIIGVLVDITDRKRVELQAENHRRELAHLGRVAMVGELSGALAHELNQPLAAILANARAGQRFLAHDPPNLRQVHDILGAIVHDDRRAGDVIMRLRALLRKDDAPRERLDVNDALRDVIGIVRSDLVTHEISVVWALEAKRAIVAADRVQLQQVFLNLVLNACDAMQATARGRRRLTVRTVRTAEHIRVSVTDTGPGVGPDGVDQIFEPFVTSKAHGLGLGLAICRSIVSAHDGRVWAQNDPNGGATFHLELPLAKAPMPAPVHS